MKSAARSSPAVQWLSQRHGLIAWGILAEGMRPEAKKKNDQFEEALGFPVGGRTWQLNFSAPMQSAGAIGRALPWLVLAVNPKRIKSG